MKKLLPLVFLVVGCGDTYNNTYVVGNGEQTSSIEINNCEDVADRLYECNPEGFEEYAEKWGTTIEHQLEGLVEECSPEKMDYFVNDPEMIVCLEQNSCEYIKAGNCEIGPGV